MSAAAVDEQVTRDPGTATRQSPVPISEPARRWGLLWITVAVVAIDWGSKALAWRTFPGRVIINADTSGVLPVLPGLVAQPIGGSLVDAAVLILLSVSGLWLTRHPSLPRMTWFGCVLIWAGAASNAADRWLAHVWLAPGSRRGVVDWVPVPGVGSANLADFTICVGVLLAVVGLALSRLPRRLFALVATGVLVLVPISLQTATGAVDNATASAQAKPSFEQEVRRTLWVGPAYGGRRVLWRDWRNGAGLNIAVEAVGRDGQVLAQWRLPWMTRVDAILLPERTDAVYVHWDDGGRVMTLADGLA